MESTPQQIYTLQDLVNVHQASLATEKLSKGWIVMNVDTPKDSTPTEPPTNGVILKTESPGTEVQTSTNEKTVTVTTCTQLPSDNVIASTEVPQLPSESIIASTPQLPSENVVATSTQLPHENVVTCTLLPNVSTCTELPTENDTLGLQSHNEKDGFVAADDDNNDDNDEKPQTTKRDEIKVGSKSKRKKKRLAIDPVTEIDLRIMKNQLLDTSDIMSPPDLAPPTKKIMSWKKYGGADKLFVYPARTFNSQTAVDKTWTEPKAKKYPSLYPAL